MRKLTFLVLLVGLVSFGLPTLAQTVPDFDLILTNLPDKLDQATGGKWDNVRPGINGTSYNPPFHQYDRNFIGQDHLEDGIKDDDLLALLQKVLENDACIREILGGGHVDNIRNQFFQNQALIKNFEAYFTLEISNDSRIDITYSKIEATNRPLKSNVATLYTGGGKQKLKLTLDSGVTFVGTTSLDVDVPIPSLWGNDGLIAKASPGLDNDLRDLMAAYLTIGQLSGVDYMQALLFQLLYQGVFPNAVDLILSLIDIKTDGLFAPIVAEALPDIDYIALKNDKLYDPGTVQTVMVDTSFDPPEVVSVNNPYIAIRRVKAFVTNIKPGIMTHWLSKYQNNLNGFSAGLPTRLAGSGDLDQDGTTNATAYVAAGMDRAAWFVLAGAGINFKWVVNATQPPAPINYGSLAFLIAEATGGTGGAITYQWYDGADPSALTLIPGATQTQYNALVDYYSTPGHENARYYRCVASTYACGADIDLNSQTVKVTGGAPPPISFTAHPEDEIVVPGQNATLSVVASVGLGTLSYQWQKWNELGFWTDVDGATGSELKFMPAVSENAGTYRCVVTNTIGGKDDGVNEPYSANSNSATLSIAPTIVIDPNPVGADLTVGDDYTLYVGASVEEGQLSYRWQFNPGTGYGPLSSLIVAEDETSFESEWEIIGATLGDSGIYRVVITNDLAPYGEYSVTTALANVNVSSGQVFYVDPTGENTTGESWENAFWTLQDGVNAAGVHGGEVWVAGGPITEPIVYDEQRTEQWGGNVGDPGRVAGSLVIPSNVSVYGGFEGYRDGEGAKETRLNQRNRAQNIAIIDGSKSRSGQSAFHTVVFGARLSATSNTILDGFHITGGRANGIANDYHTWRGGGVYVYGSSPTISNCMIYGNEAAVSGGAIAAEYNTAVNIASELNLQNCIIFDNTAQRGEDAPAGAANPLRGGGAIFNNRSSTTINFCTIMNNTCGADYTNPGGIGEGSGGIFTWADDDTHPVVTNSIVWGNTPGSIAQSEIGNPAVQYVTAAHNIIQMPLGVYPGTSNLNDAPKLGNTAFTALVGQDVADYIPLSDSPALDAADANIVGGDDFLGVYRTVGGRADIGALELSEIGPSVACQDSVLELDLADDPDTSDLDPFDFYDGDNSVFAEAPLWTVALAPKTFDCDDIPTAEVTLVVADILGRTDQCVGDIAVTETVDPSIQVTPITRNLDANGEYTLTAADLAEITAGSSDNCTAYGDLIITAVPMEFDCNDTSLPQNVTVTIEDAQGNTDSDVVQVTIKDTDPPVAPDVTTAYDVFLLPNGTYTLTSEDLQAMAANAEDNCELNLGATSSNRTTPFTCSDIGTPVSIMLTVYDLSLNTLDMPVDINVIDEIAPDLGGIAPKTRLAMDGEITEGELLAGVTAEDRCDGDLTASIAVAAFDEDDNPVALPIDPDDRGDGQPWIILPDTDYLFTLVYTVSDNSGNEAEESTVFTLFGLQLPEITVVGDDPAIVECPFEYLDDGATAINPQEDNNDITSNIITVNPVNTGIPGIYTVTYSVAVPGYPSMPHIVATRTVEVVDTEAPVITVIAADPLYWQRGVAFPNDSSIRVAADECEGDITGKIVTTGAVDVDTKGSYALAFDVTDDEGNVAATEELTVIVVDLLTFTNQSPGTRLYTTSDDYVLSATYKDGANVTGYEWFQNGDGLGFVADSSTPNTIKLSVTPADLGAGFFDFHAEVSDDSGQTASDAATLEIAPPLTALPLEDVVLAEEDDFTWSVVVSGGLGTIHYQWQAKRSGDADFVAIVNGVYGLGSYDGAGTAALKLAPYTSAMDGEYRVEVSDDYTTIVVGPAKLGKDVGVPAVGVIGLSILALASALGGARALRRRK